ncbi:unnamed protein product [Candida verbasci]|uniref:Choline/carnitine acyltransferase domain-containing protein n=1 Tax=Candida verbasci TaxID=1227364 RepID=A0A9W4XDU5_9ASCO|nr:unnamed protein product [Candida verbasci]
MPHSGDHNTFENESSLRSLPVPSLQSTTQQLLSALKPLVPTNEYAELLQESAEFISSDLINLIQQHLEAIGQNPKYTNYLNVVNNDTTPAVYGELKGDILPRNPYLILEEDPYSKTINPPNQAERSANLINSTLKFIVTLRNGTLKPDRTPKNNNPLTMNCYKHLFGTTRAPDFTENSNDLRVKKYLDINDSRHILIIANNQYYKLEVLTPFFEEEYKETYSKHKIWFNDHELSKILQLIIDESDTVDPIKSINNAVGSITTQSLKNWKIARLALRESNKDNMKLINDALFVLVLDPNSPKSDQEKTSVISHGTSVLSHANVQIGSCTSRWYDKLQMIVTRNSVAGVVWESMSMDSTAILRFISDIYTDSVLKLAKNINGSEYTLFDNNVCFVSSSNDKPEPEKIQFNLIPEIQNIIHLSETRLADLINQHEYKTHMIKLESNLCKKFNLSVDSIMQVCFQITNYSLYGRMVNTLEPITTRKFKDARTELIPVQNESLLNLVKLYISSAKSQEKFELFKKCSQIHTKQYLDAMNGKGFERHLMSIVQVIKKPNIVKTLNNINTHLPTIHIDENTDIPLLLNPNIEKLTNPELLISNCGNPALLLFGIPPAVDQGFGIGYIIHHDKVIITVCSKHRQTERFIGTFHKVIQDLKSNLRHKSNFLLSISDSQSRKMEIQRLRVERELSSVSLNSPSTSHPIKLTVDKDDATPDLEPDNQRRNSTSSSDSDNFELMGGYGYFDYGELELRRDLISKNESYLNSTTSSNLSSPLSSKHHSGTNLVKLATMATKSQSPDYDLKQKQSLSERIRDKLSRSEDTLPSVTSEDSQSSKPKNSIGRSLDISQYH